MAKGMGRVSRGSRMFVTGVFILLAAAFIAETAVMFWEFGAAKGQRIASFDSQLFLFFPTLGLIALLAFWRAGVVVVDAYWRFIPGGKAILIVGFVASGAIALYITDTFRHSNARSWWEIAPVALEADQGAPGIEPILKAHNAVRAYARSKEGLSGFIDQCDAESLQLQSAMEPEEKYCVVAGERMSAAACCAARRAFKQHVIDLQAAAPSVTFRVHHLLLPLKIYFLLILLGIGVMLARRRKRLEIYYPVQMPLVEALIPVGGVSMLAWPLMNHAYTQSWDVLYGGDVGGGAFRVSAPIYTLIFGAWALLLLFYYFRRYPDQVEMIAKIGGFAAAGVGILRYDEVLSYVNRFIGSGADIVSLSVYVAVAVVLAWEVLVRDDDAHEAAEKAEIEAERAKFEAEHPIEKADDS